MASTGVPLSVEDIVAQANNFEYNVHIPLRYWLRSADAMQKEAQVYQEEGNEAQTYLLLFRHASLVLDKLPNHPQVKDEQTRKAYKAARKIVEHDLAKLEQLRPRIAKRHADYQERQRARQKTLSALEGNGVQQEDLTDQLSHMSLGRHGPLRQSYEKTTLDAGQHRSLAAELAQREIRRRDAARRSVRQAGVSAEEEHQRRSGGVWGDWEYELRYGGEPLDDLSRQIQEAGQQRDVFRNGHRPPSIPQPPHKDSSPSYHYPSVPHKTAQADWSTRDSTAASNRRTPVVPPKEPLTIPSISSPNFRPALPPKPPKPPKLPEFSAPGAPFPPHVPGKYVDAGQTLPAEIDSNEYAFKPSAYLENGTPLRTVFLPPDLRHQFLARALPNTRQNLETCGILCGILKSNALFISRLVIPEQKSTSDTCETVNEQALFDYCDKEDLMVLGWIHTHPSQTCFMSSRDLHTHCGYQVMMPESIAIVCAPSKQPSWGVFRLTDPPGMKTVLNCSKPGLFHPHDVDNIYTDALKPGHVFELPQMPFDVVDLRP